MLNENAKKWVEALRSGDYQQGQKRLLTDDGKHCCLGVACDLAEQSGVIVDWRGQEFLPDEVKKWLGLDSDNGEFTLRDEGGPWTESLADKNDSGKAPFATIADIIESEPEGLFAALK